VRHIGLWNTGFDSKLKQTDAGLNSTDRADRLRKYVESLTRHITKKGTPSIEFGQDDKIHPLEADVRAGTLWLISFWWHGIRASIRLEHHTEYITLTSILDLSIEPKPFRTSTEGKKNYQSRLRVAFNRLAHLFEQQVQDDDRYLRIAFLQNEVWKEFEREVIDASVRRRPLLGERLGVVFADFRGMVTGSLATLTDDEPQAFYQPFRSKPGRPRTEYINHDCPDDEWPRRVLKRLWPLIQAEKHLREFEFTASGLLDGRVVYVSALGPRVNEELGTGWDWTPVYFYMHTCTDDPWQIGRLINRMFALGSFRLASIVGINRLVEAGATPDTLGVAIDNAVDAIRTEMQALGRNEPEQSSAGHRQRLRLPFFRRGRPPRGDGGGVAAATKAAPAANGCNSNTPDDAVAHVQTLYQKLPKDFFYRLERSNYYIEQFALEAKALRERRIEGFQKYEEFVARRLGGIFSYIGLLGKRMKDIDTRVSNVGRAYAAFKTAETTCRIDSLVRGMTKQDNEIRKIQDFGEAALIGFIIPYYAGSMLIKHVLHFAEGADPYGLWPSLMTIFAAFVVLRTMDEAADASEQRRTRFIRIGFLGYIAFIWGCFWVSLRL